MLRLEASWQAADDNKQRHEDNTTTQETVLPFYISNKKRKNDTNENVSSSDDDNDDQQKAMLLKNEDEDEEAAAAAEELEEEETALESLVFGSSTSNLMANIDKIKKMKKKFKTNEKTIVEQMIQSQDSTLLGLKPAWQDVDDNEVVNLNEFSNFSNLINTKASKVTSSQIEESLKARFTKYYGTPMWADLDMKKMKMKKKKRSLNALSSMESQSSSDDDDDDEEMSVFQQTGNFLSDTTYKNSIASNGSSYLPKSVIDVKICADANKEEPHQSRLKCVEFHPSARVMLTAGLTQKLTLFQIDGKKNAKIQSIFIEKFPILAAHFTKQTGDEIIMGSRHKAFYVYDMHSGKMTIVNPYAGKSLDEYKERSISTNFEISADNRLIAFVGSQGQIHLFSCKSKEWIDTLKINGECNAVTFSSDSRYLFAFGDDKDVYVFDMNDRGHKCLHKFTDFGCLSGTSIAVSNNSQYIATGCKSGVVNIYNLNESLRNVHNRHPVPLKSFMNLTTPCTSLKFNSTSEILAACSAFTENACKLIHVDSLSVFSNFPLAQQQALSKSATTSSSSIVTAMRIPECVDFSLNSGYLTIGNHKGNALLYRLKHYGSF